MSKSIKGTRTEKNLLAAFAGESQEETATLILPLTFTGCGCLMHNNGLLQIWAQFSPRPKPKER